MEWISVEDRLPDDAYPVLVCFGKSSTSIIIGNYVNGGFYAKSNYPLTKITHWMPLPEPPKE